MPIRILATNGSVALFTDFHGRIWRTDGTAAGTRLVEDIFPGPSPSAPEQLEAVAGKLFFTANDGVHGRELWLQASPP